MQGGVRCAFFQSAGHSRYCPKQSPTPHTDLGAGWGVRWGESLPARLMWKPTNHLWGLISNGRCLLAIYDSNPAP